MTNKQESEEVRRFKATKIKAEQEGDAEAQFKMGVRYHKMKDHDKAAKWHEMAAEKGHAEAHAKRTWLDVCRRLRRFAEL